MILFDIRVTTTVNWLGAPRCLRQMKWCSEQEEASAASIASSLDLDLGDKANSIIQLARGILASGKPIVLAA